MSTIINDQVFESFPVLTSERLAFRHFTEQDASAILALRSHPQVMTYLDAPPFQSLEDARQMIDRNRLSFEKKEGINWVITEKGQHKMIGYFGIWRLDRKNCRGEIGYGLHPDYWGKGYMVETLGLLLDFAFNELQLHSIEANVNPQNEASKKVLTHLGFQQEAYFRENYFYDGHFLDSAIYCLLASDSAKQQ